MISRESFTSEQYLEPVMPAYGGRCNASIVPAMSWDLETEVLPNEIVRAAKAVVLVLDSLGWKHLDDARKAGVALPQIGALDGGPVTTVAPSTTSAALTSISTGVPPGEHGIVGYRFPAGGEVMNALRWSTKLGDWRGTVPPTDVQQNEPLAGGDWTIVADRMFINSGFTEAYLGSGEYRGVHHPSSLAGEARAALEAGASRVYAYYDGLDHVAHIYGVAGRHFADELRFCDWLIATMAAALPSGTALIVTADHGQIDAPELVEVGAGFNHLVRELSGEPRFRWLHGTQSSPDELLSAAEEIHGHHAWVKSRDQVIDEGWLGPRVTDAARHRLGDVALIARSPLGFADPAERNADRLVGRHGSFTGAEMYVPALHCTV